jgi:hypothetical protein
MRCPPWIVPVGAVLAAAACSTHFNPGRCDQTSDCQSMPGYSGYVCDLDPISQGDGRCVPPCTTSSDCTGGRVCNFDSQGVGRCLLAVDGGVSGAGGSSGGAGGASGEAGGPGGAPATGGAMDGGQDVNPCNACAGNAPICLQGSCVECAASSDCTAAATKPICDATSHTCVPCTADGQCSAKLGPMGNPGVCRSEIDGHCAADAETVYVQNSGNCTTTFVNNSGGTATAPYCSMEPVALATNATKTLVVIRGTVAAPDWTYQRGQGQPATSFVGQQSAVIASATTSGFAMDSGIAYIRDLKFSPSATVCVSATGGTLNLKNVVVDSCQGGGIFLDGAAFDIEDTAVTNNGPGTMGTTTWGGVLVASLPSTGPSVLNLDTVEMNKQVGITCAQPITGTGVYAAQNTGNVDINSNCGFSSCSALSSTCGAP